MGTKRRKSNRKGFKPVPDGRGNKNSRRMEEIIDTAGKQCSPDQRERRDARTGGPNDWRWYAQNPDLVRNYASFPFGVALGTPLYTGISSLDANAVPGVMAIRFKPMIGSLVQDATSPINISSRNIYSFVRHANSGHTNYDAPDLMMYILAMDSIYMYHAFLKRLLGVLMAYTPVNRYYPQALVTAMGVNFDDIQKHIVDLRGYINQYAVKIGSMCVPNSMSYMARHSWMCTGIYVDSQAAKAQTYMYVPDSYYQLTLKNPEDNSDIPTSLKEVFFGTVRTFDQIVNFGNKLMEPILSNEDMNIMSGDILKAFGPEGVVKIAGVPDGYIVLPEYNQEVLSQIENTTILSCTTTNEAGHAFWITQDTTVGNGHIKYAHEQSLRIELNSHYVVTTGTPKWNGALLGYLAPMELGKRILNFHHDNVTPEEVMVATRMTNIIKGITSQGADGYYTNSSQEVVWYKWVDVPSAASEIAVGADIYYFKVVNGERVLNKKVMAADLFYIMQDQVLQNAQTVATAGSKNALITNFDWAPQSLTTALVLQNSSGTMSILGGYTADTAVIDIDNYTIIDVDNLRNLALTALLSEFSVPQMGAFATKL